MVISKEAKPLSTFKVEEDRLWHTAKDPKTQELLDLTQPGMTMPDYPKSKTRPEQLRHEGQEIGYCEVVFSRRSINEQVVATVVDRGDVSVADYSDTRPDSICADEARTAAEAANRAKSVFLSNMSHELRTPLNSNLGYSQILSRSRNLPPDEKEHLDTIMHSGEHLLELINDVLELSKIKADRVELQPVKFDLHQMLSDLEDMFRLRAERKGLTLEIEYEYEDFEIEDVPEALSLDFSIIHLPEDLVMRLKKEARLYNIT